MIKVGDRVRANKMSEDSFYAQVIGTVIYIRNGFVGISADSVMDKWCKDKVFTYRDNISVAAKESDVVVL
jgi:hypothetical protein